MQIRMRYFARLYEITGLREEALNIAEGATVAEARVHLLERYPVLASTLERAVSAVNHQYVPPETVLAEGDELVFIPPVGGGMEHVV